MTYHVEVNPNVKQSTHHVALSDGKKTIGLICCDSRGAADPFNISAAPNQRSSLRTKSGTTKYEDLEEPWSATAQDDWSGGRALEDYENDTTRFFDSKRCQTAFSQIYNAPLDYYATGLKNSSTNHPASLTWKMVEAGTSYGLMLSLPAIKVGEIYIHIRRRGKPESGLNVSLHLDSAGEPGGEIVDHTYTVADFQDVLSEFRKFTFPDQTLSSGTYWLIVSADKGDINDHWEIGLQPVNASNTFVHKSSLSPLPNYDLTYRICAGNTARYTRFFTYKQLTFALTQTVSGSPKLYINGDIGMADSNSGQLSQVIDATKSWTTDMWKGCKVGIIQGTGIAETVSVWRTITSNTATTLTVDSPWTIAQDTTSTYIITDTERFTEVTGHGLTAYVTDIEIVNDIIYFAQGDSVAVRKGRWRNGSWSWMADSYVHKINGTDTTINNCAMYLQAVRDSTGLVLWRAQNNDASHQISISQTAVTDWLSNPVTVANYTTDIDSNNDDVYTSGVDFTKPDDVAILYKVTLGTITGTKHPVFTIMLQGSDDKVIYEDIKSIGVDASGGVYYFSCNTKKRFRRLHITIKAGTNPKLTSVKVETVNHSKYVSTHTFNDSWGKINGLMEYPMMTQSIYRTLWIYREGMIHSISSEGTVDNITLPELASVMEEWNGKVLMSHNVYSYFRWMKSGIQRYYNQQVDAVGPDRDTGLPDDRQGQISDMMGYPGRYFAAIDAGDGYSSVLLNNNSGWHEIYRAPNAGERITALGYQAISGDRPDRLWIAVGDDIVWLAMPSNTLKAYYDDQAEYTHESVLVSSWMSIGMVDVIKQWGSMNVMAENLEEDAVYIEADYQIDQDPTWYQMADFYTESPTQEVKFKATFGVTAKRLRYRLRLQTNDKHRTPFVKAVVLKTVIKVGTKYCYAMSCRNLLHDVNLRGEVEDISPWERLDTLVKWANDATALHMEAFTYPYDDKIVFIDPPTVSNLREEDRPGNLLQLTINEI